MAESSNSLEKYGVRVPGIFDNLGRWDPGQPGPIGNDLKTLARVRLVGIASGKNQGRARLLASKRDFTLGDVIFVHVPFTKDPGAVLAVAVLEDDLCVPLFFLPAIGGRGLCTELFGLQFPPDEARLLSEDYRDLSQLLKVPPLNEEWFDGAEAATLPGLLGTVNSFDDGHCWVEMYERDRGRFTKRFSERLNAWWGSDEHRVLLWTDEDVERLGRNR